MQGLGYCTTIGSLFGTLTGIDFLEPCRGSGLGFRPEGFKGVSENRGRYRFEGSS